MPIAYPDVLDLKEENQHITWNDRDVMLYALALGMGANDRELDFVYEKNLKVVPTLVAVAAFGRRPLRRSGINYTHMVHAGQHLTCHKPIPTNGNVIVDSRISNVTDKGVDRGALFVTETLVRDKETNVLIASMYNTIIAKADGGFGGPSEGTPPPHRIPNRPPDVSLDFATKPQQALLYRLCGDRNAMHADPAVAAKSGFPRPVLHGFCTYGMACRAVLAAFADYDAARVLSHEGRFASLVFPGDTVTFDLWRDENEVSFEARVKARNATVMSNGKTVLGA